ncbi:hypothetical protein D9M70_479390 [compost metagenome]
MAGLHRHADLAVCLEAADAGPVACAGIDDDEGTFRRVDHDTFGRNDAHQRIVHRPSERASVADKPSLELQHVRSGLRPVLLILRAALPHHVKKKDRALPGIERIGIGIGECRYCRDGGMLGHSVHSSVRLKAGPAA